MIQMKARLIPLKCPRGKLADQESHADFVLARISQLVLTEARLRVSSACD